MKTQTFIGFAVFLVIAALVVWFFIATELDILLGVLVGLVPSAILLYQERQKAKREDRNWLLRNKEACLIEMVDAIISGISDKKGTKEERAARMVERLQMLRSPLLIWGSPSFISAWNQFQRTSHGGDPSEIFKASERLFRAIRKELEHDDSDLVPGEVLATILRLEDKGIALDACRGENYEENDSSERGK